MVSEPPNPPPCLQFATLTMIRKVLLSLSSLKEEVNCQDGEICYLETPTFSFILVLVSWFPLIFIIAVNYFQLITTSNIFTSIVRAIISDTY